MRANIRWFPSSSNFARSCATQRLEVLQPLARVVLPTLHFLTGMLGLGQQPWGTEAVFHDPDGNSIVLQQAA
jgi:hypothetical protein